MSGSGLGGTEGGGFGGGGGGNSSKHLLEIEVVGLKRRLWAAESKQECRRWVSLVLIENEMGQEKSAGCLFLLVHFFCCRACLLAAVALRLFVAPNVPKL